MSIEGRIADGLACKIAELGTWSTSTGLTISDDGSGDAYEGENGAGVVYVVVDGVEYEATISVRRSE